MKAKILILAVFILMLSMSLAAAEYAADSKQQPGSQGNYIGGAEGNFLGYYNEGSGMNAMTGMSILDLFKSKPKLAFYGGYGQPCYPTDHTCNFGLYCNLLGMCVGDIGNLGQRCMYGDYGGICNTGLTCNSLGMCVVEDTNKEPTTATKGPAYLTGTPPTYATGVPADKGPLYYFTEPQSKSVFGSTFLVSKIGDKFIEVKVGGISVPYLDLGVAKRVGNLNSLEATLTKINDKPKYAEVKVTKVKEDSGDKTKDDLKNHIYAFGASETKTINEAYTPVTIRAREFGARTADMVVDGNYVKFYKDEVKTFGDLQITLLEVFPAQTSGTTNWFARFKIVSEASVNYVVQTGSVPYYAGNVLAGKYVSFKKGNVKLVSLKDNVASFDINGKKMDIKQGNSIESDGLFVKVLHAKPVTADSKKNSVDVLAVDLSGLK